MIRLDELFPIGSTHKPHALQGEITCSFTNTVFDDAEAPYFVLDIDNVLVPFFLESYRFKNDTTALVKFEGIDTEKAALELADTTIYLPLEYREQSDEENVTLQDLIGFEMIDKQAGLLGILTDVDDSTLNTLFIIEDGKIVLPAHDEFVEDVDYDGKKIYMNIPQELLEL